MYREHFGLRSLPFENVPDPAFFFDVGDHHRILQRMTDAVTAGRGLLSIAGPIGSGKTTLSQKLMADMSERVRLVWLAEPPGTAADLFRFLAEELGAESGSSTRVFVLRDVRRKLLELQQSGRRCLMIIDESHLMADEVLEGVRLLNNLEEGPSKLLQIILLGQQELVERFSRPEMEAFRQRIAGLEVIGRMEPVRVKDYILHRLGIAGGRESIFTARALEAVALATGGVPRKINSLCDRSLRVAWEDKRSVIDAEEVHRAATELGLGRSTMRFLLEEKSENDSTAAAAGGPLPEPSPLGMLLPALLFVSSLGAFGASLLLYCGRAASRGGGDCLQSLLARLF